MNTLRLDLYATSGCIGLNAATRFLIPHFHGFVDSTHYLLDSLYSHLFIYNFKASEKMRMLSFTSSG